MKLTNTNRLNQLAESLEGELLFDAASKAIYATDASVYRIIPTAVAFPINTADLQKLVAFATTEKIGLIMRTAGTSLAGQCVGNGIVVDVSKHFTQIFNIDTVQNTVTVAPGVIRDDLNRKLQEHQLFFGPNTSTSNRCMIGGMVGNNSSGTTSIKYGVTRDKVLEMEVVLADGSIATFGEVDAETFFAKAKQNTAEGRVYKKLYNLLAESETQENIKKEFPKAEIHRRNTGYAIDELIKSEVFLKNGNKFNLCKLLCGSEGTLAITTKIKLHLDPLPPTETVMVAAHFKSIKNCLKAVRPAMKHGLFTCEMMDKVILDCTKGNLKYNDYRFFIEGDPEAILLLEIKTQTTESALEKAAHLCGELQECKLAYALPILQGEDINKALELRKAGLGLLGNMVGDEKAVACIEDTAVALDDLAAYIDEFTALMERFNQKAVYYAHAGAGELHLRPILNLKKKNDVHLFQEITIAVAHLVKKYNGSMSGEHGDGIVRSSFIPLMIGSENFEILRKVKHIFDPHRIMNPGKIIDSFHITNNLRYIPERIEPEIKTLMDFSDSKGVLRATEKCNGSGDCLKPEAAGGTMCPSFRVTKNEKDTTRGRANALREFLTNSEKVNRFNHKELKEVFDLCISCKGCKSECPSNVDMAALKAEFEYQYQKKNGKKIRNQLFANNHRLNKISNRFRPVINTLFSNSVSSYLIKKSMGVSLKRELPLISTISLNKRYQDIKSQFINNSKPVYFFIDEFTEFLDTKIGIDALELLFKLGYQVQTIAHSESGRAMISKGFLDEAKKCADINVSLFKDCVSASAPLVGIEPSAILTFRDEYLRLASDKTAAKALAKNCFTIEEFLSKEIQAGRITTNQFTDKEKKVKLHLHCHQKALSTVKPTFDVLNLPVNYEVTVIPSGCCGMAGSFGYEKEHYNLSMQMGELTLFPAVRKTNKETFIAASGTSCRHQIKDGTQRVALHPISILRKALKN